jgi:hypothetical protein
MSINWISVKNKLPETEPYSYRVNCLLWDDSGDVGEVFTGWYDRNEAKFHVDDESVNDDTLNVTHWSYLNSPE